jgi:transcriptional regulator with XRE-family HTH domain
MTPTNRGDIGKRIRFARSELASLRVAELAAELGVLPITVYRWETAQRRVSLDTLERIADFLHVSRAWLVTGHGEARAA